MLRTDNWAKITLDQVASPEHNSLVDGPFGSDLKMSEYTSAGVRLIQLQNIGEGIWIDSNQRFIPLSKFNDLSRHAAYPGDIAIAKMADPVARACIVPHVSEKFLVVADCIKLSVNLKRHNPHFIVRAINHLDFRRKAEDVSTGTTRQRINLSALRKIPLWVPSLTEQNYIADMFDDLDMQSQRTEQLIAKLKQQREGLLHDLLTRGLDENGELRDLDVHPESFKDSVLGMIPMEWEVVQIGQIAEMITSGPRGWGNYYSNSGPLFLRIGNLTRDHIHLRLNDLVYVSPPNNAEGARTAVKTGDVLISITADLGMIGVIPENIGEAYVNQHIALIRFNNEVCSEFIANYLTSNYGQIQFSQLNDAGAKAGLNLPTVAKIFVPFPSKKEQEAISLVISSVEANIFRESSHLAKLKQYKQGLMHDLLTGRVRVGASVEA